MNRKKIAKNVSTIVFLLIFLVSCATLSKKYVENNIRIATHPGVVANLAFVDGWTSEYGTAYGAQAVGILVANNLAEKGWHDIWILVEMQSRGDPRASFPAALNSWKISVYKQK
jgi:hypothetical protein